MTGIERIGTHAEFANLNATPYSNGTFELSFNWGGGSSTRISLRDGAALVALEQLREQADTIIQQNFPRETLVGKHEREAG